MYIKINGKSYKGKILDAFGDIENDENMLFIEIYVTINDENIIDDIYEAEEISIRELNKLYDKLKRRGINGQGVPFYDIDLRTVGDFSTPTFNLDIEELLDGTYSLISLNRHKGEYEGNTNVKKGDICILKLGKTNELFEELYKSKGVGIDEGMAKLHYLSERFVSYILDDTSSTNFNHNLSQLEILDEEKEILKVIKKTTGCFAHGNTTTREYKNSLIGYYKVFYDIMEQLILKYT